MTQTFELDDFYDLTLASDIALSPDGDRLAFVASEFDRDEDERRTSLFVVPTDGSDDPYRLSRTSDAGSPNWSPDGSKLGFLAGRDQDTALSVQDEDVDSDDADEATGTDDDEPKSQVWVFDLERGGDARQVIDREEGVREFDWGPNGDRLVVSARDPTEEQADYLEELRDGGPVEIDRLQHRYDGKGFLDDVTTYLFVVDVATREERRLDDAYGGGSFEPMSGLQPTWGSNRIAFISNRTERPDDSGVMDVYTIDPDGTGLRRVTDSDLTASAPRWSPDGARLAFIGSDAVNWHIPTQVYVSDDSADGEYRSVTDSLDRTVAHANRVRWMDDESMLAPVGDEGSTRLVRCFADGSAPEFTLESQDDYWTIRTFDHVGDTVALLSTEPETVGDLYALDVDELESGEPVRLTSLNDSFEESHAMPDCRRVVYENDSGDDVEGIAYLPADFDPADTSDLPLIVSIHGGPISYDAPEFKFEYAYWTDRGFVVFRLNYRGSSSYGREFSEVIRGDWGAREVEDVLAGVDHLVERGWVDIDRTFATGFSYGGITTGFLVTSTNRFAGAAAEHGIYDLRSCYGTDDAHKWWENDFGLPWENPEAYDSASSITDVGNVETPLLVTTGGDDWRCPPSQSEQLYVSVKKQGVPSKLVVYPDEHHNIGDPDRAVHRIEELTEWFETHDPGQV
ncbi:prolyl oligopeptidase family serine peptidase [Haladaptatus sp. DFWS20]|uniref:S9 family peptidase n=1 Tax=Haladaptatus sp. DFWS20 TaxID=3403467 RepID=UPI003EBC7B0B